MSDEFDAAVHAQIVERSEVARLRRERDSTLRMLHNAEKKIGDLERVIATVEKVESSSPSPPKWLAPAVPKKHHATAVVMLSDLHLDEVVNPEEVGGANAYDREIAQVRLRLWAERTVKMSRDWLGGVTWDGCVVILGGDLLSGEIHEELKETNDDTIVSGLLHWSELLCAALDMLVERFGRIHIVSVPGNHGRTSRKPRAKLRAKTNFDWLLSHLVARGFRGDKRVTAHIPESLDCMVNIYDRRLLINHGETSGGGGIGGIWPPIQRLRARKLTHYAGIGQPFDAFWIGHWHQFTPTPSLVVNGSMKGMDEYSLAQGFAAEPPAQAFGLWTPERGQTIVAPIYCADREREGW